MERKQIVRYRIAVVGLLVVIISMLAGFAVASAVVTNSDGSVNGCYSPKSGKLRVNVAGCKAGKESAITLGGLPKSYYADGGHGTITQVGLYVTVQSVAMPAGTYAVSFNTIGHRNAVDTFTDRALACKLVPSPGNEPTGDLQVTPYPVADQDASIGVNAQVTLTAAGTIEAQCTAFGTISNGGQVSVPYQHATMTAVRTS